MGNLTRRKMGYLPGFIDLICFKVFNIGSFRVDIKHKNCHNLVKNGSPDMILTPFEGKFDEKKDEIPPGICRPHMLENIQYWEFEG